MEQYAGFTQVVPDRHHTGESPVWDAASGRLFWTSIEDGDIHAVDPATGARQKWHIGRPVGSFGLCESGLLVVARRDHVLLFDPQSGDSRKIADIPMPIAEARLNDGKVGPDGAFWVGSMDERPDKQPIGALYRVGADGSVRTIFTGMKVSNGLAWSPDGHTMYFADSRGPWIAAFDFDPATGAVGKCRRIAEPDDATGRPDGGACDVEGGYWSAGPSASVVNRFSPEGHLLASHKMPNYKPTMPCFGGPDMKTLFVTSLSHNASKEAMLQHPWCGSLISMRVEVAGAPVARFRA